MATRGPSDQKFTHSVSLERLGPLEPSKFGPAPMFSPFGFCAPLAEDPGVRHLRYQESKLRMLTFWRDGLERQLAAVTAAMATLEQQMERDRGSAQN
jgi:hypothetical protein